MAAATPTATLIDVVVLVFARSELKSLVGTDALRTVLGGSQREMFPEPGSMSLQPVWELIESQPGFDAEKAVPPMCRIKAWEGPLKVKVKMPDALADLDLATREKKAMECNVGDDELHKVLKPTSPLKPSKVETRVIETSSAAEEEAKKKRSIGPKVALLLAFVGLAAAGISIYVTLRRDTGTTVQVSASDLATDLPIVNIRRSGPLIVATMPDPKAWLAKPEADRRKQVEAMTPKVREQRATGLVVFDTKGNVITQLKLDRTPPVVFPPPRS